MYHVPGSRDHLREGLIQQMTSVLASVPGTGAPDESDPGSAFQ